MPYPESCPECGGAFRNTGTHYTARRNEVGRHVLLELGCQNTSRRYWWNFTTGVSADDNATTPVRRASFAPSAHVVEVQAAAAPNGSLEHETNGHAAVVTLEPPELPTTNGHHVVDEEPVTITSDLDLSPAQPPDADLTVSPGPVPVVPPTLKEAFLRQLQLDRLTLRQMRTWLMADDARRAMEVAAGATEATYERLALILFGVDLPQLLGKQATPPPTPGMSAEERLELQREKARIRARLRRAAAKAARQT
ncbi:MAG: hypothetical protein JO352_11265 [Chloroflexi bacterium]|nr:hypothetical protein [Chloroflexota bacterium]MBV9595794.1 hypothetical protein [Chloroflexota bacterium]